MIQLEVTARLTYRWWRCGKGNVRPEDVEELKEHAMGRIEEMRKLGCTSGELLHTVRLPGDSADGVEYRGYWEWREGEFA